MGKVVAEFTMSLDGFIAGPDDDIGRLFAWYYSGDIEFSLGKDGMVFKVSRASAELLRESWGAIGALVTGRRDFDVSKAWGGKPPFDVPMLIVTHTPPEAWLGEGSPFTFVTDGVVSAVAQARVLAGDRVIGIGGSQITQQCLRAGLIDEIQIHLAHMLLGDGIRLFGTSDPIELEKIGVIEGNGVTHLRFRVVK